jgi:hypothetical protein
MKKNQKKYWVNLYWEPKKRQMWTSTPWPSARDAELARRPGSKNPSPDIFLGTLILDRKLALKISARDYYGGWIQAL